MTDIQNARILIADDLESNRTLLQKQVVDLGFAVELAVDGQEALAKAKEIAPDLILLDLHMPKVSGFQVLEKLLGDTDLRHIPVIVISGRLETETIVQCLEMGAVDYLTKPFNPQILRARIIASLRRKRLHDLENRYQQQIEEYNHRLERRVREQLSEILEAHTGTIFALSRLAESRDEETGAHLERIREYCRVLSDELSIFPEFAAEIDEHFIATIYAASPLHDIGKVGIPDSILRKPGRLSPPESDVMKGHSIIGAETLRAVDRKHPGNEFILMGIEIAESHHERFDGSGYPNHIAGAAIPLSARITALADVYDALTAKRCYKAALSHHEARQIIEDESGKHFDPAVVHAFLNVQESFVEISAMKSSSDALNVWRNTLSPEQLDLLKVEMSTR